MGSSWLKTGVRRDIITLWGSGSPAETVRRLSSSKGSVKGELGLDCETQESFSLVVEADVEVIFCKHDYENKKPEVAPELTRERAHRLWRSSGDLGISFGARARPLLLLWISWRKQLLPNKIVEPRPATFREVALESDCKDIECLKIEISWLKNDLTHELNTVSLCTSLLLTR